MDPHDISIDSLPLGARRSIDRICSDFERAWTSGVQPKLEEYWVERNAAEGAVLLKELLYLDWDYRERRHTSTSVDELVLRFPTYSAMISDLWLDWQKNAEQRRIDTASADTHHTGGQESTNLQRRPTHEAEASARLKDLPNYEVERELGRGGMATVFLARDRRLNRLVALKLVSAAEPSAEIVSRFQIEAQAVARLQHPNIVQVFEVGEYSGRPFLALEYVSGGSLADHNRNSLQSPQQAARWTAVLAQAIQYAHQHGIVHRDLKPANVLVTDEPGSRPDNSLSPSDGLDPQLKITDFGLAKCLEFDQQHTQSGMLLGTPSYMAPEQAAGRNALIGPAADIYALGAILYELLTARPPFKASTVVETALLVRTCDPVRPRQLQPSVPRDLETICLKCLEKDPSRRYKSAADLADDLAQFQRGEPIRSRPVGRTERSWRWCRRHPTVAALGTALMLLFIASFCVVTWQWHSTAFHANEAIRQKKIAEDNFEKVRLAIDEYFTTVSEETLLNQPGMHPLRERLLQTALRHYEGLIEHHRQDPEFLAEIGAAHFRVGRILQLRGNGAAAIPHYDQAVASLRTVIKNHANDRSSSFVLAKTLTNQGAIARASGEPERARQCYAESTSRLEGLLTLDPDSDEYLYSLCGTHINIALLEQAYGKWTRGRPHYEEVIERLESKSARTHQQTYLLVKSLVELGRLEWDEGNRNRAEELTNSAVECSEELVAEQPSVGNYLRALADSYSSLAVFRRMRGESDEAVKLHGQAVGAARRLVAANPTITKYRSVLAQYQRSWSGLYVNLSDWENARRVLNELIVDYKALVRESPHDADVASALGHVYNELAHVEIESGRYDRARELCHEAYDILNSLVETHPALHYRSRLATSLTRFGDLLVRTDAAQEATGYYRRAISILHEAADTNPEIIDLENSLAQSYRGLGSALVAVGRLQEASDAYDESIRILRGLHAREVATDTAMELAVTLNFRAYAASQQNDFQSAWRHLDEALRLSPDSARVEDRIQTAWMAAVTGRLEQAATAVNELVADQDLTPGHLVTAAQVFGRLAIQASNDTQSEDAVREELGQRFTTRAIELLYQAQDAGAFQSAKSIQQAHEQPDFELLRSLDDYRRAVAPK